MAVREGRRQMVVGPEHLELLGPAFDLAWTGMERRRAFPVTGVDLSVVKDRLARLVVDLVLNRGLNNREAIADAAIRELLSSGPSPGR